ncbi:DUF6053 domain-containing protein [Lysobacter yananisis]|uniref:DUF6053 domain-containing protein n=1 Tax=Lysobacter yananisis TaxID=1003114 RepID=UPI003CE4B13D
MGGTSVPTLLSQTAATRAKSIGPEGPPTPTAAHCASWKITPSVCRVPARNALTPWRRLTR